MEARNPILAVATNKGLERTAEDLESAAARHGLRVTAIHDLVPGDRNCRVYEVCHEACAKEALSRRPDAAILVPCRILLRSGADGTRLSALLPGAVLGSFPDLREMAGRLEGALRLALSEAVR